METSARSRALLVKRIEATTEARRIGTIERNSAKTTIFVRIDQFLRDALANRVRVRSAILFSFIRMTPGSTPSPHQLDSTGSVPMCAAQDGMELWMTTSMFFNRSGV